ncbi:zinc-dependent metalloprotease [Mycobacterium sp. MYCO198283]|uniref:zinc-dependent metalloprotease n=1 Tax=Mycobacterium sp. MYCO198283 TaxID=2883505 RepID=UPI001E3113CF|nr:zinc-dependent metalloprotease [Mycobacterium sp. MYCO198283]MCG5431465.1 zinc-dependent metalloprotease [Mycobacterium sp. MYCO198283]
MSPRSGGSLSVGAVVDWDFAAATGARLARPAPPTTDYTREQSIAELAEASRRAEQPVRDVTRLAVPGDAPAARIVDRPQWVRAAAHSMRTMTGGSADDSPGLLRGRLTGAQTGAVLAFVSSGILGQYDPFGSGGPDGGGVLLLVYPNVIAVERQLRVRPTDFRMWVCLHEVTHRVQFAANPWLAGYMSSTLRVLTEDAADDMGAMVGRLGDFLRDRRNGKRDNGSDGIIGLLRAVQAEPQREALDRMLVLGTLLEGHADHVMDAVGPAVVPSVATIRHRFEERRRRHQSPLQRLLRALLGIDAKMSQYTRGKAFVDAVVADVGMERFNTVWTNPDTLPLPDEIDEPRRWIDRVL